MKKIIPFLVLIYTCQFTFSQYCGASGSLICTPSGGPGGGGFEDPNTTPCAVQTTAYSHAIQFKMFSTLNFVGPQNVDSIEFVSIDNLPCGLCWGLNQADKRYTGNESGCLKISGTTTDVVGQYKLSMALKVWINNDPGPISLSAALVEQTGIALYLRVKQAQGNCANVDVSGSANNLTASVTCPPLPPALGVSLGPDHQVCTNAIVNLSASVTGGTAPFTYAWSSTGNSVACNTCQSTSATITQNSTFTVTVTDYNLQTATSSVSALITIATPLVPAISITASPANALCEGNNITFTAVATNGGSAPVYQWKKNSNNVGSNSNTYTDNTLLSNEAITCVLTSNANCLSFNNPVSNSINVHPLPPTPVISQVATSLVSTSATTYQWYLGATAINGATEQFLTITQDGQYRVEITDANGCKNTSAPFNVGVGVGVDELNADATVSVYPNPNNGTFTLQFTTEAKRDIQITDATGKLVTEIKQAGALQNIILPETAQGIYLLRINESGNLKTLRLNVVK